MLTRGPKFSYNSHKLQRSANIEVKVEQLDITAAFTPTGFHLNEAMYLPSIYIAYIQTADSNSFVPERHKKAFSNVVLLKYISPAH